MKQRTFEMTLSNGEKSIVETHTYNEAMELPAAIQGLMDMPFEKDKVVELEKGMIFGEIEEEKINKVDNVTFAFLPNVDAEGKTKLYNGLIKLAKKEPGSTNTVKLFTPGEELDYLIIFDRNHHYAGLELSASVKFLDESEVQFE